MSNALKETAPGSSSARLIRGDPKDPSSEPTQLEAAKDSQSLSDKYSPMFAWEGAPKCYELGCKHECRPCKPGPWKKTVDLRASADGGCPDCRVLIEGIDAAAEHRRQDASTQQWDVPVEYHVYAERPENVKDNHSFPVRVALAGEGKRVDFKHIVYFYVEPEASFAPDNDDANRLATQSKKVRLPVGTHVSAHPVDGLDLVKSWLHDCDVNHANDCHRYDRDTVPYRLLDIRQNGSQVFLKDSQHLLEPRYVALSYCWGHDPDCMLKTANVESMRVLTITELPGVFQDAILFSRRLGFQYLWIDALCI